MAVYVKAFYDWVEQTAALSDAERGRLFVAMLEYARSGEVPALEGNERILFPVFKAQIDREEAAASVKAQSGAKGGKGKQTEAQASKSKQTDFLQANTPNKEEEKEEDNEKEKEEEYEYEKEKECVKEKGALPLYPLRGRHTPSLFILFFLFLWIKSYFPSSAFFTFHSSSSSKEASTWVPSASWLSERICPVERSTCMASYRS